MMLLMVTVLPVPTSLVENAPVAEATLSESPLINPVKVALP
jgi:hypothetical protein